MPQYKNPFTKGQLIVKFNVTFPEDGFLPTNKLKVSQTLATQDLLSHLFIVLRQMLQLNDQCDYVCDMRCAF